jgi:hypothetical protein
MGVACGAERDQVLFGIMAGMAAKLFVVLQSTILGPLVRDCPVKECKPRLSFSREDLRDCVLPHAPP